MNGNTGTRNTKSPSPPRNKTSKSPSVKPAKKPAVNVRTNPEDGTLEYWTRRGNADVPMLYGSREAEAMLKRWLGRKKTLEKNQNKNAAAAAANTARLENTSLRLSNDLRVRAFMRWDEKARANLHRRRPSLANLGHPQVPKYYDARFQTFIKDLVTSRTPVLPSLVSNLQGLRNATGKNVANILKNMGNAATAVDGCKLDKAIQVHQAIVLAMAKMRADGSIDSPGLLGLHSTGSGKTLIGLSILLGFWDATVTHDTDNKPFPAPVPKPVFFVSTRGNQRANNVDKLAELAVQFYPGFVNSNVAFGPRRPFTDVISAREAINARMEAGWHGMKPPRGGDGFDKCAGRRRYSKTNPSNSLHTFQTLWWDFKKCFGLVTAQNQPSPTRVLRNCVIIIDEVQFLVRPVRGEEKKCDTLQKILFKHRDPATTWVVGLTATPGESAEDVAGILNAVNGGARGIDFSKLAQAPAQFQARAMGLVSYANLLGDRTHFAGVKVKLHCVDISQIPWYCKPYMRYVAGFGKRIERKPKPANAAAAANAAANKPDYRPAFAVRVWEAITKVQAAIKEARARSRNNGNDNNAKKLPGGSVLCLRAEDLDGDEGKIRRFSTSSREEWEYAPERKRVFFKRMRDASNFLAFGAANEGAGNFGSKRAGNGGNGGNGNGNGNGDGSNQKAEFEDEEEDEWDPAEASTEGETLTARDLRGSREILISPKIKALLENIKKYPRAKHFVYATTNNTIVIIAHLLEKMGIRHLKHSLLRCENGARGRTCGLDREKTGKTERYFALINDVTNRQSINTFSYSTRQAVGNAGGYRYLTAGSDRRIEDVKLAVNNLQYWEGFQINVILATGENFKGVDMNHIQHLHLMDPMVEYQDFIQFIGRGPRNCSHAKIAKMADRTVTLHMYRLQYGDSGCGGDPAVPKELFSDCHLWDLARKRYEANWKKFEQVLEAASVDHQVFKDNIHVNTKALETALRNLKCDFVKTEVASFAELKKRNAATISKNTLVSDPNSRFDEPCFPRLEPTKGLRPKVGVEWWVPTVRSKKRDSQRRILCEPPTPAGRVWALVEQGKLDAVGDKVVKGFDGSRLRKMWLAKGLALRPSPRRQLPRGPWLGPGASGKVVDKDFTIVNDLSRVTDLSQITLRGAPMPTAPAALRGSLTNGKSPNRKSPTKSPSPKRKSPTKSPTKSATKSPSPKRKSASPARASNASRSPSVINLTSRSPSARRSPSKNKNSGRTVSF